MLATATDTGDRDRALGLVAVHQHVARFMQRLLYLLTQDCIYDYSVHYLVLLGVVLAGLLAGRPQDLLRYAKFFRGFALALFSIPN